MTCKERENIDEIDAWDREIGEVSKCGSQAYLCTGEFGGTGGRGGGDGELSRGIVCS